MRDRFGGLIFGGAYFLNFTVFKHFGNSLNSFRNELDPAEHTKERPRREMNIGKKTVMKVQVSSRWFYRQQGVLKPKITMDYRSLRLQKSGR